MEMEEGKRKRQAKEKLQAQCRCKVRLLDPPDDNRLRSKILSVQHTVSQPSPLKAAENSLARPQNVANGTQTDI